MMKKRKNTSDTGAMTKKAGHVGPKGPAAASLSAAAAPPLPQQQQSVTVVAGEVEAKGTMPEWAGGPLGDQQMWWEGQWFPSWDVQVMGEAYISALYSDVWDGYDDDIWGFRNSDRLPTTRPTPSSI